MWDWYESFTTDPRGKGQGIGEVEPCKRTKGPAKQTFTQGIINPPQENQNMKAWGVNEKTDRVQLSGGLRIFSYSVALSERNIPQNYKNYMDVI